MILVLWFGGRAWYFAPNASAGEPAATFTVTLANGNPFSLEGLRGKTVLLDFWGSWCGPCRAEVPQLQQLYRERGDELAIVSIAIERDSSRWLNALARDGRSWPYQIMDETSSLKFLNGELADLYGINSVPSNVVVNGAGEVVAVNIDLNDLSTYLP
ncbi:TlpA disulfide reductase family protein [Lewinella sp. 4G2]|uniref:TlpA family protein disulfide reductase n=1 Tax=Lewinella sp. 4G2 TaxID=1803372 RepID=UPI0007B4E9D9|nr:TlpA disulfide reductase family protein [Lewinella sp. 4G2]